MTGAPGSGKSAFLRRVVDDARHQGFRTVVVSADRVDADVPHAATRLALDPLLADETDPSLQAVAAGAERRAGPPPAGADGTGCTP